MSDLVISYGLLNQAANDIQNLSPEIDRIQNSVKSEGKATVGTVPGQVNENNPDLGPGVGLYHALGAFYSTWQSPTSNAMDGLDKLAGYFKGVADTFQEADASMAGGLNAGAAISAVLRYPQLMDQYVEALEYMLNPQGVQVNPDPSAPIPVSNPFSLAGTTGLATTFTMGGEDPDSPPGVKASTWPNDLVASETTTVTQDGMHYSETTTFGPDQGWGPDGPTQDTTQLVTNPNGSTDTVTVTTDTSGKATMTDLSSATGTTTTYTRADWTAKFIKEQPAAPVAPTTKNPPITHGR
jgi:hypothetical protein